MLFGNLQPVQGRVLINKNLCKGCGFCVQFCPMNVLDTSSEFNAKGYHPPYVKAPEKCRDCMFCELICPDFAIRVERLAQ
ncbi:ferredoxin family protein [uncultured Thiodictyon sp.]|uniref:4Fe-4S dicluster domain-containing protein n=1 Tax=uncultured Thiodictyon sp. TaxID=1846217 RepID=UPI0025E9FC94|nr:ferredoxin family protein [uncultured Thiodictyon sp.]